MKQKLKKLEKTVEKVRGHSVFVSLLIFITTQDAHTRSENEMWITHHQQDLEKKSEELTRLAANLKKAEAELDTIRSGLQGKV